MSTSCRHAPCTVVRASTETLLAGGVACRTKVNTETGTGETLSRLSGIILPQNAHLYYLSFYPSPPPLLLPLCVARALLRL